MTQCNTPKSEGVAVAVAAGGAAGVGATLLNRLVPSTVGAAGVEVLEGLLNAWPEGQLQSAVDIARHVNSNKILYIFVITCNIRQLKILTEK